MGQTIEIRGTAVVDTVLVVDTDRSLAGQDGEGFDGIEEAREAEGFPAVLAGRLFEADAAIDHVFVMSNTVTARRASGWDDASRDRATAIIAEFFLFYR